MNRVDPVSLQIKEATILDMVFLADDGFNDEMLYILDNGMALCFRWYCDPLMCVGQKITWTEEGSGIRVFYGNGSEHLRGNPGGKWFECR